MTNLLPKDRNEWMRFIKNTALIILGTFILAFGVEMFIFRFDLVTGGVSGLGIILFRWLENVEFLSGVTVEVYSSVVNWILFVLGILFSAEALP